MSDEKDGGKTVIRPMPGMGGAPARPAAPPAGGGQKTVIGGVPPAAPGGGGWGTPPQQPGGGGGFGPPPTPGGGGGLDGPDWGAPQQPGQPGTGGQGDPSAWMGAQAKSDSFFPDMARPEPSFQAAAPSRKISLDKALSARISGHSAEANPITAAAANLLILFGRLRSQVVDMQAVPLMQYVTEEIEAFERNVIDAGIPQQDALVAKYCLCGTADDIVQNLPGTDRATWLQYSMSARFFNKRTAGVGFFQELDKALQNPAQKYFLLELMLTCLQLGFEGQYRGQPGGDVQLQQIKRGVYDALRTVKPRLDDDISPQWKGVEITAKKARAGIPVWAVAILCMAILSGAYIGMRTLLVNEGNELATRMTTLHPSDQIEITRNNVAVEVYTPPVFEEPENSQFERLTEALAGEAIQVGKTGDFIVMELNNSILFDSGKADVKDGFESIALKIATALDAEPGPVRIVGHTDNIPMSGRGRYKNNVELSLARAEGVAAALRPHFSDQSRIETEGRGEDEPIADNGTSEGRAQNRRVEIMIQREETLN